MPEKPVVLFVDDEEDLLRTVRIVLGKYYDICTATSGIEALEVLEKASVDIVVCDISMPDMGGIEVLKRSRIIAPAVEVIMLTALNDTQLAMRAAQEGAYDFLIKPFDPDSLRITINRALEKKQLIAENQKLENKLKAYERHSFQGIIGVSGSMKKVFDMISKVSQNSASVLIEGETGTGKELIARAVHTLSDRRHNPFIAVNCGAIPRELFESEFFGYEKGAFTGASLSREGKFEAASGGTLFLDEVSSLPLDMQVKLLRVIQEREVYRIGSNTPVPLDVRLISACNVNLKKKVSQGEFREDLYHRIAVVPITVPPLRQRPDDIKLLAAHFLQKFNDKYAGSFRSIEDDALAVMNTYAWPGNVRELEHIMERLVSLEEGTVIRSSFLPLDMYQRRVNEQEIGASTLSSMVDGYERSIINAALQKCGGNQCRTAQMLGLSRTTLISKMKNLGLKER